MQFENTFSIEAPIDRVWEYLLDVQSVAPCVPGAEVTEVVSDTEYKGTVKVKLGAVQVSYKGTLVMQEINEANRQVVLVASGSETRGTGSASGTVTSYLVADTPSRTTVRMVSEVNITGRVAQFGRSIMQDVSNRLIREFALCLEKNLEAREEELSEAGAPAPHVTEESVAGSSHRSPDLEHRNETEPLRAASSTVAEEDLTRPSTTPTARPLSSPPPDNVEAEPLKLMPLLMDVVRSRAAATLRALADLVEPRTPS